MPYDYFVRITHPYASLAALVGAWALRCEKLVAYEHTGTQTEKVHVHLLILGSSICSKQLRNIGKMYVNLKGNELCTIKECVTWEQPVVYMTKGKLDASYAMGFTKDQLDELKAKWVEPKRYEKKSVNQQFYESWEASDWKQLRNAIHAATELQRKRLAETDAFGRDSALVNEEPVEFQAIKKYFRNYVFTNNHHIWDQQAVNKYKMMVMTYCFRNDVSISSKTEWDKWM